MTSADFACARNPWAWTKPSASLPQGSISSKRPKDRQLSKGSSGPCARLDGGGQAHRRCRHRKRTPHRMTLGLDVVYDFDINDAIDMVTPGKCSMSLRQAGSVP